MLQQKTIQHEAHAIGIGVHSGQKVGLRLRPAPANSGIVFVRRDLPGRPQVTARADLVCDTSLSTSIACAGAEVSTVEHLLSALWGLGVDNVIVELTAQEVPIMDGSAAPFIDLIEAVGVRELNDLKEYIRITRTIEVSQGDAVASLSPFNGFRANYTFVADHPVYNRYPKSTTVEFTRDNYVKEVSAARSFGLVCELEQAQSLNRCLGSSLENAVGIDDNGVLNPGGLRYQDEFVKHKVLDAIGDLYLLGRPILGEFSGYMSGHALNNKLARALLRCENAWEVVTASGRSTDPADAPVFQPAATQ